MFATASICLSLWSISVDYSAEKTMQKELLKLEITEKKLIIKELTIVVKG